jgi:hypothetical protein
MRVTFALLLLAAALVLLLPLTRGPVASGTSLVVASNTSRLPTRRAVVMWAVQPIQS